MTKLKTVTRGMKITETMQFAVEKHLAHLESFYDRIEKCEVTISLPHRHHHKGKIYHVAIKLDIPRGNIVVNREAEKDPTHEDFYKALADTFHKAERLLREQVRCMRGFVKTHGGDEPTLVLDETVEV